MAKQNGVGFSLFYEMLLRNRSCGMSNFGLFGIGVAGCKKSASDMWIRISTLIYMPTTNAMGFSLLSFGCIALHSRQEQPLSDTKRYGISIQEMTTNSRWQHLSNQSGKRITAFIGSDGYHTRYGRTSTHTIGSRQNTRTLGR